LLEYESGLNADEKIAEWLAEKLSIQLNLRFEVIRVSHGDLPRSEGKAKRLFDRRLLH